MDYHFIINLLSRWPKEVAMNTSSVSRIAACCAAAACLVGADAALLAQDAQDDEDLVVVTGTRIRQGGSQDIRQFRSVALDSAFLPRADSLTIEGLLGEYDLSLPAKARCDRLFCISGHAMKAALPLRPQDDVFVGLGFESNIDATGRRLEPLSLVAVLDKSGSMTGDKIARAKQGLITAVSKMRDTDRFGVVIFGDDAAVLLPVTDVGGNRERIVDTIAAVEAEGSTDMESGLRLGYRTAFGEQDATSRKTRVMLLTDEQPNVGNTQPEGFMGQAVGGSRRGVGLTTIGVGRDFDNALAMQISSMRGGNLFYLARNGDAEALFQREFYNMVSEVAHDVTITMTPSAGYKINAVYGVPNEILAETPQGAVTVTIGSAFLSSNAGGIYTSLERTGVVVPDTASAPIMSVAIGYTDAQSGVAGSNTDSVSFPASSPPPANLFKAQALVDEYLSLSMALKAYHEGNDAQRAYTVINGLNERLTDSEIDGMAEEKALVANLRNRAAVLAGISDDVPDEMRPYAVLGRWEVTSQRGLRDVTRGDVIELTSDGEFNTYRKSGRDAGTEINQSFQINENQLHIDYTNIVFTYRLKGDSLRMRTLGGAERLNMKRISRPVAQ